MSRPGPVRQERCRTGLFYLAAVAPVALLIHSAICFLIFSLSLEG
jgi:hypothetical protein